MLPHSLRIWTAWLCLVAIGLTSAIIPKASAGGSALVLCVGCEQFGVAVSAPCMPDVGCCSDARPCNDEAPDPAGNFALTSNAQGCGCLDIPFPSQNLPAISKLRSASVSNFVAVAPALIGMVSLDAMMPKVVRHIGIKEPPWELSPRSRTTVWLI